LNSVHLKEFTLHSFSVILRCQTSKSASSAMIALKLSWKVVLLLTVILNGGDRGRLKCGKYMKTAFKSLDSRSNNG
jgi:hypothetical protein